MVRNIVTNIKELRKPCELVTKENNVKEILQDLKDTLLAKGGIGLTANQIGIDKKISYIKIPNSVDKNKQVQYSEFVLINAKIIEHDRPIKVNNEMCLSFPRVPVTTRRYVFITIEYLDENLKPQINSFQDLESLIIQHESDHQSGLTIFDRKWRAK